MNAMPNDHNRNILYRIYNADDGLLYVGATTSLMMRIQSHSQTQRWWDEVALIRLDRFETFEELVEAETAAIRSEHPKYNMVHAKPPVWAYKPRRPRGDGAFCQRANGLWVGRIELPPDADGRRRTKQVTSMDRDTALRKFEELKATHGIGD